MIWKNTSYKQQYSGFTLLENVIAFQTRFVSQGFILGLVFACLSLERLVLRSHGVLEARRKSHESL